MRYSAQASSQAALSKQWFPAQPPYFVLKAPAERRSGRFCRLTAGIGPLVDSDRHSEKNPQVLLSADFWMNLQSAYELDLARQQSGKAILRIPRRRGAGRPPRPLRSYSPWAPL